jgi:hypothetical protein
MFVDHKNFILLIYNITDSYRLFINSMKLLGGGIAQSAYQLTMGWTTEGSEFESR